MYGLKRQHCLRKENAMNEKIETGINNQINMELSSSYLYLSMATWCEANNLRGAAHWLKTQAHEEMLHMGKMYTYINDRDGRVKLLAIPEPKSKWSSVEDIFKNVLNHEKDITAKINELVGLSNELNDHATLTFLQWFVTEQVEEEANARDILDQIKLIGDAPGGLYMLDKELATRQMPQANAQ